MNRSATRTGKSATGPSIFVPSTLSAKGLYAGLSIFLPSANESISQTASIMAERKSRRLSRSFGSLKRSVKKKKKSYLRRLSRQSEVCLRLDLLTVSAPLRNPCWGSGFKWMCFSRVNKWTLPCSAASSEGCLRPLQSLLER